MEKTYKTPPIVWLKVTDYMHGWLQYELGCAARVRNQRVVSLHDIPEARDILRMETVEDMMEKQPLGNAMSATRRNCLAAGMEIDPQVMEREYGVTKDVMDLFVPIECPVRCITKGGVLRPWTLDVCLGKNQASAMQRLIRQLFWNAVTQYDRAYAERMNGERYPAADMIEAFCQDTGTSEIHIPAMRREWQRRVKREKEKETA